MIAQVIPKIRVDWSLWGVCKMIFYGIALGITNTLDYIEVKYGVVAALALAMAFDTGSGIWKSYVLSKTDSNIKVTSKEGKKGIMDKVLMLLFVLLLGVVGKLLGLDLSWLVVNALILLVVFEMLSSAGNILTIRTGKPVQEFDAITFILKYIRSGLKGIIEAMTKQSSSKKDETSGDS